MPVTGVLPSCLRKSDSDNDYSNPKQTSDEDSDSGILAPHKNEKISFVERFHRMKETQVKMTFDTHCPVLPSSWKVIIDLTKSDAFHNFHFLITMIRTDSGQIPLEGIVLLWFKNDDGKTCPISYRVSKDIPFRLIPAKYNPFMDTENSVLEKLSVDEHFSCLLTEEYTGESSATLPKDLLILKIQLFISGCCDRKKDKNGSKMRSGGEGTSRMHSGEEGTSQMHFGGEGTSQMHFGGEGTSRMHSEKEGTSRMHSEKEGTSRMHSEKERTSRMHSGGESTSNMSCLSKL